jgi:hypothetical protein
MAQSRNKQHYDGVRPQVDRKFSTPIRESHWWRASISKIDLTWVRTNLGRFCEGLNKSMTISSPRELVDGALGPSWPERVAFIGGERDPCINILIGERYEFRQDYEKARRESDPHLSPHGLFRAIENGFHYHALQFMQQFGPLTWKPRTITGRGAEWIRLSDFWDKHARFVGVSMLWEGRSDVQKLKDAWNWIYARRDQIDRVGPAPFGYVPLWELGKYSPPPEELLWEREEGFESALNMFADLGTLQQYSLQAIQSELNAHTSDCRQIWMMNPMGIRSENVTFKPMRGFSTLWGAIWDLFGQDTSALKHSWRVCLECGRLFYPRDHRSVCCTTAHQALWSKRKWAREHRRSARL